MNMSYQKVYIRQWKSNSCMNQIFKELFWIEFENNIDSFDF